MTIPQIFVVFFASEFIFFLMVLPLFNPTPPADIPTGHASSAPANPRLRLKLGISLILTTIFTACVYGFISYYV